MKCARSKRKATKTVGLPDNELYQHLEKLPATSEVTSEFLAKHVWWWQIPDIPLQMWIADQAEGWPHCELHKFFKRRQPYRMPQSGKDAQDRAREYFSQAINTSPELRQRLALLWDHELDAAKGYELEARDKGSYPCGVPYNRLTRAQRREWINKYWRLNLNSTPPIWKEGASLHDFDTDKLTSLFRVSLGHFASGASVGVRFNLRHGDGWLTRAFQELTIEERKRFGISNTEELRRKEPARIREFRQFVTKERQRLGILKSKHEGKDRRPLNRSWADIENIDIKTQKIGKTTPITRQRESVTRRKLLSPHERQRQVAGWKLTVLH